MSGSAWTAPLVAAVAAPLAGIVVALVARRRMPLASPGAAWAASAARGAAAALAVLAAAGPVRTDDVPREGSIVAAGSVAASGADRTVVVPSDAPDARSALEAARAAAPADAPAELVLSVGRGDGAFAAPSASTALRHGPAIAPSVLVAGEDDAAPRASDAAAPRLDLPSAPTSDVPFWVAFHAGTTPFRAGTAVVTVGDRVEAISLADGAVRAETPPLSLEPGRHVVVARFPDRDAVAGVVEVGAPPRILVVTTSGLEPPLGARLRHQGIDVTVASERAADLAGTFDVVVLGPGAGPAGAAAFAPQVVAGSGLLVLGGPGRAGLSRLRGTALEDLLPVVLPPVPPAPPPDVPPTPPAAPPKPPDPETPRAELDEGEKDALRIALLLVVDRSGSMAGVKLAMAQQSAIAAARTLSAEDRVGVLAFDDEAEWIVPFQAAGDATTLYRKVAALRAGGGTNFHTALRTGYRAILGERCGIRHVILVTDGVTRPAVFREMVEEGTRGGVTLSTIAIGDGADTQLLALLAGWGRGRLYPATDPERLPQVVTMDARRFTTDPRDGRARREAPDVAPPAREPEAGAKEPDPKSDPAPRPPDAPARLLAPRVARRATFLAGLERETWPQLRDAEAVTARGAATAPLVFDGLGPALVVGRAGAGRVAVLAAEATTDAAREWWAWPDSGRFLAQIVRSLATEPVRSARPPRVEVVLLDDGSSVAVVGRAGGGTLRLRSAEGGDEILADCVSLGGVSAADVVPAPEPGLLLGTFAPADGGPKSPVATSVPAPRTESAAVRAARVAEAAGAPLVRELPRRRSGAPSRREEPAEVPYLAVAALLLVAEAAARRRSAS